VERKIKERAKMNYDRFGEILYRKRELYIHSLIIERR
jgi:hypothetical protein